MSLTVLRVNTHETLSRFHFYSFFSCAINLNYHPVNKCLKNSVTLFYLIEVNLSLFNALWPWDLFKYFIVIEIALKKLTLNIKFNGKFYLSLVKVRKWKVSLQQYFLLLIHSFPSLITEKFMRTIIAYGWIIEDSWRWINCTLMLKYQYASYFYKYIDNINP